MLIYQLAPNHRQRFSVVTAGSVGAALLLVMSSLGFARHVGSFGNYSATDGSMGAVIISMLWLFRAGLSVLLGAEPNMDDVVRHRTHAFDCGEPSEGTREKTSDRLAESRDDDVPGGRAPQPMVYQAMSVSGSTSTLT